MRGNLAKSLLAAYRDATAPITSYATALKVLDGATEADGYFDEGPEERAQTNATYDLQQLNCGDSFTAGTLVLLASGKAAPISALKAGQKVLVVNTKNSKDQLEEVTAVLVQHDVDLYNLIIKTKYGTEVIRTTSNHLFWNPVERGWIKAGSLRKGDPLRAPGGAVAYAEGGFVPADHQGWMWDITVSGNDDHDFYILPGQEVGKSGYYVEATSTPVLVHNCSIAPPNYTPEGGKR